MTSIKSQVKMKGFEDEIELRVDVRVEEHQ
jgi:hypothetical protein